MEKGKSPLMTASGLMAKSVTCTFCKGAHRPKECPIPFSVEDRFNKVEKPRLAFVVFGLVTEWSHANMENHANVDEDPTSYSCVRQVE